MTTTVTLRRAFACALALLGAPIADALTFNEPGFTVSTEIDFGIEVTNFEFAPHSDHIFIAQERGIIQVYDNLDDTTPTQVADLRNQVGDWVDHGMLGLTIHPEFPTQPYIYIFYTLQRNIADQEQAERPHYARLSRLRLNPSTFVMEQEQIFIDNWCQNSLSHGVGDLRFGPDGALYVSAGDGANPQLVDIGGDHCGDPFNEGGALRSQDYRTPNDPLGYNGTMLRLDPDTGAAMPDNPNFGQRADYARVIAYGLRNPFRFAIHPTNGQIFISDVGWNQTEEINHIPNATDNVIENFGWPCYEGNNRQGGYDNANVPLCEQLYSQGGDTKGFYTYDHNGAQACPSGIEFYIGGTYPARYRNALFFADYAQNWIKVWDADGNGNVDKNSLRTFAQGDAIVDMQRGPGGDLFYIEYQINDIWENGNLVKPRRFRLRRIAAVNPGALVASVEANVSEGAPGLSVRFNGGNSTHPTGAPLNFAWDLDGDGEFDDSTGVSPTYTYDEDGVYPVSLRISDAGGNSDIANIAVFISDQFPEITINSPTPETTWATGDSIAVDGSAIIPATGAQAQNFRWTVVINHCAKNDPTDCHKHNDAVVEGATGTVIAPDHEYPSNLEFALSASGESGGVDWFDTAWQKRRLLFIDNYGNAARNAGPARLLLNSSRIDYNAAGPGGSSLRFVDINGTVLRHDVGTWNTGGESRVWVELPAVPANSSNTYVWMYYDNPSANNSEVGLSQADQSSLFNVSREYAQTAYTSTEIVTVLPQTAVLTLDSLPSGLTLGLGSDAAPTPHSATVIVGSTASISASSPQVLDNVEYAFDSWEHGGEALQNVVTWTDTTLLAFYAETGEYNCNVANVFFRGTPNNWGTLAMAVVDADAQGCIWAVNAEFAGLATDRFKFDILGDWTENYGDTNKDGIADRTGADIVPNEGAGNYYITFHSVTKAYTLTKRPLGPQPPVANAGADRVVRMHTDVTFDGSASSDADGEIVSYVWTSNAWQGELTGVSPMFHFHDTTGVFNVSLTVTDDQGLSATDVMTVTVNPLQAPNAVIDGGNVTVVRGSTVTFNSTGSGDPDGVIVGYRWDNDDETASSTRTFNDLGSFTVSLTVTDDNSLSDTVDITVTVVEDSFDSLYPQVHLRGTFNNFAANTLMTLIADNLWYARAEFDGATTARFKFDINGNWVLNFGSNGGDNVADQGGGDIFITQGAGFYDIRFNDLTKVFSVQKFVGPQAPVVELGATRSLRPGDSASFTPNVTLEGGASVASYAWTSNAWSGTLSDASITAPFSDVGTYQVNLTVTDSNGLSGTDSVTVVVAANAAPVASIAPAGTVNITVGGNVSFSGAASSDTDGTVASYLWDNGDTGATSTRTFNQAGQFNVSLVVTDNEGAESAPAQVIVNVQEQPSTVNVNFSCANGSTTTGISIYVVGNIPALGNWTIASAAQKLNPTAYPTWSATLNNMPANSTVQWKCVKANETTLAITQWEGGADNVFTTTHQGVSTNGAF